MVSEASVLDRMLDPVLAGEAGQRLLEFKLDAAQTARLEYLRERANEGLLTEAEAVEYARVVDRLDLIAIIKAEVRGGDGAAVRVVNATTRAFVRHRAGGRCEYCLLPEHASEASFHVEHVRARQHGGADDAANLAYACDRCNCYKGTNLSGIDPPSDRVTQLFDPRSDRWDDHFRRHGFEIVGVTPVGRTTAALLRFNDPLRVRLRSELPLHS